MVTLLQNLPLEYARLKPTFLLSFRKDIKNKW